MWIHVDLTNQTTVPPSVPSIVQVASQPDSGSGHTTNGKFVIPTPLDLDFIVDSTSYVLDGSREIDGGDVSSQGFALLLARYPQYEHVYFNPLLTDDHVDELVLDQSSGFVDGANTFYPRFQVGRSGLTDPGQMPTATAIMPVNSTTTPSRPGFLITDEIDISSYTQDCDGNTVGAVEFMAYWKLLDISVSDDKAGAVSGVSAGLNTPVLRTVGPTDDEPTDFTVYLSTDNGVTWCEVSLLEPMTMCERGTSFRLAFRNDSATKRYLAHFAVMFRADL